MTPSPPGTASTSSQVYHLACLITKIIPLGQFHLFPQGIVSTIAGNPGHQGFADGCGTAAQFNEPAGITVDAAGDVLVADYGNHCIRKVHARLTPPRRYQDREGGTVSNLQRDMSRLLKSGLMTDITFAVGSESVAAHRVVLAARSEYFAALLTSDFREARDSRIEIEHASPAGFRALLHYLYTDSLLLEDEEAILDVMQLAHRYQIADLFAACMRRFRLGLTCCNAIARLVGAHDNHLAEAQEYALAYVSQNWKRIRAEANGTVTLLKDYPPLMMDILRSIQ